MEYKSFEELKQGDVKVAILTDGTDIAEIRIVDAVEFDELSEKANDATAGNWSWHIWEA